jgi:hypothetical protein
MSFCAPLLKDQVGWYPGRSTPPRDASTLTGELYAKMGLLDPFVVVQDPLLAAQ